MPPVKKFRFNSIELSAYVDEESIDWFRGTDVCKILGFSNPSVSINRICSEYSQELQVGMGRPAVYVNEPGLYTLIFNSKSDKAKKFQTWVLKHVLPELRTQGYYIHKRDAETLQKLEQEVSELRQELEAKKQENKELKQQNKDKAVKLYRLLRDRKFKSFDEFMKFVKVDLRVYLPLEFYPFFKLSFSEAKRRGDWGSFLSFIYQFTYLFGNETDSAIQKEFEGIASLDCDFNVRHLFGILSDRLIGFNESKLPSSLYELGVHGIQQEIENWTMH